MKIMASSYIDNLLFQHIYVSCHTCIALHYMYNGKSLRKMLT
uniref:Uncharacterized protein n=2 Tax=Anguilla anguilla TaxID=7936 RepID=A0A0E9S236_ANGAN